MMTRDEDWYCIKSGGVAFSHLSDDASRRVAADRLTEPARAHEDAPVSNKIHQLD